MTHKTLVVSHADADGHLIAEQVRRNLAATGAFEVSVVVDSERTRDHKSWLKLGSIREIENAEHVFFMDLMFAPASFYTEAFALVDFVSQYPHKQFYLIDHHPLPVRRLSRARNLHIMYRPDVYECAIGPRSGIMVVAAICEHQAAEVTDIKRPVHDTLAVGVRRAAAEGSPLAGQKLLALFAADCWDAIRKLGEDDSQFHRLPRGRRPRGAPLSETMQEINHEAEALVAKRVLRTITPQDGETAMAYDADIGHEKFAVNDGRHIREIDPARSRDLEGIITLLEVAALSLTPEPGATFTIDELVAAAREIAGEGVSLRDMRIVLEKGRTSFLQRVTGKLYRLK